LYFKEQINLRGTTVVQVRIFWPTEAVAVVEQPIVVPVAVTVVLG